MPFDLDSIEDTMNRRMRTIWVRHATFLTILGFIALVSLIALTVYLTAKPTVLKMAVGPKGSKDVEFVDKLADKFKADHASMRIEPIVQNGPVTLQDIRGKAPFDLAVVRGNIDLSTDWPVVAILREDVVVLIQPPAAAFAPKRNSRGRWISHDKIEKVTELVDKTVGIVEGTDGGPELLSLILKHYGVPADKVKVVSGHAPRPEKENPRWCDRRRAYRRPGDGRYDRAGRPSARRPVRKGRASSRSIRPRGSASAFRPMTPKTLSPARLAVSRPSRTTSSRRSSTRSTSWRAKP